MKKKVWIGVIAGVLVLAAVLGIAPKIAINWGSGAPDNAIAGNNLFVTYSDGVTVDGALDETEWLTYMPMSDQETSFGAVWHGENLYLAFAGKELGDVGVSANGTAVTLGETVTADTGEGKVTEVMIPLSDLGIQVKDYSEKVDVKLQAGEASWEGVLSISSMDRGDYRFEGFVQENYTLGYYNNFTGDAIQPGNLAYEALENGARLTDTYMEGTENGNYGRVVNSDSYVEPLDQGDGVYRLEMDVQIDAMPVFDSYPGRSFAGYGMAVVVANGTGQGLSFAVTRFEKGLTLRFMDDQRITLNKELGEKFHLALQWDTTDTEDRFVTVYVDDVQVAHIERTLMNASAMQSQGLKSTSTLQVNLYADKRQLTSADDNIDFTYTDVRVGKVVSANPLETMSITDILGDNISAMDVINDLTLPTSWSNGQLPAEKIVWSSGRSDVVSSDGKVTAKPNLNTGVTLMAAVEGDGNKMKQFEIRVLALGAEAIFTNSAMTLDGKFSRGEGWPNAYDFSGEDDGLTGAFRAMWHQEKAYLLIEYTEKPDTMTLRLGTKTWQLNIPAVGQTFSDVGINGMVSDSAIELHMDLSEAEQRPLDYNTRYQFNITLTKGEKTAKLQESPMGLTFVVEDTVVELTDREFELSANNTFQMSDGIVTVQTSGPVKRDVLFTNPLPEIIDHRKDVLFQQTIQVNAMPVTDGKIVNRLIGEGFYFNISSRIYDEEDPNRATYRWATTVILYNSGEEGLKLRIVQTGVDASHNDGEYTDIPLGKKVGDTFTLGYRWNADNSANVYVDEVSVGQTVTRVDLYTTGSGTNQLGLCYTNSTATREDELDLSICDLSLSVSPTVYASMKDELVLKELAQVGDSVDFRKLYDSLTLPTKYYNEYLGDLTLRWTSSDESVLMHNGTVIRPQGNVGRYTELTLALMDGKRPSKVWVKDIYVMPESPASEGSSPVLTAPFVSGGVELDSTVTEEGWNLNTDVLNAAGEKIGRFGVMWDRENLYFAAETGGKTLSVTLNGQDITAPANGNPAEFAVPMSSFGVTVADYNIKIPATVRMGDAVWEGTIVLSSVEWFTTDGTGTRTPYYKQASVTLNTAEAKPTKNQGHKRIENGYLLFDYYDIGGNNPAQIRTSVAISPNDAASKEIMEPLADRTRDTFLEMDLQFKCLPVYNLKEGTGDGNDFGSYGFTWWLAGLQDPVSKMADTVCFGIFNTEDGLVLVAQSLEANIFELNRVVGEKFRLGIRWNVDDSVTVYLDGEEFTHVENMTVSRRSWGDRGLSLNLIRGTNAARSKNDDMELYITNLAIGKAYGDSLMDNLTFTSIKGENEDAFAVNADLSLPGKLATGQLDAGITLSWSSSDPAVISDTGKVTQPALGTMVTLTASASNGQKKDFKLFVPGAAASSEVLYVTNDRNTSLNAGKGANFYWFTLDENNNSVIRDLGSAQKVNVIALKDSDSINRLNENVLTIWVSDDNVTYRLVEDFKMFHKGEYVYLYGFEETARYFKVHCTHYNGAEADFEGPIGEMIDAYYEEIFGANGGSFTTEQTTTVTNNGTTTSYDDAWALVGITGDSSTRVYLGDELLYHYVTDDYVVARIPQIKPGETVTLRILSGNDKAMDIANRDNVTEVLCGTREVVLATGMARLVLSLPNGRMITAHGWDPDNDGYVNNSIMMRISEDNGRTWGNPRIICNDSTYLAAASGILYDPDVGDYGRIIIQGYSWPKVVSGDAETSNSKTRFLISDDLGETWYTLEEEMNFDGMAASYYLSYTDPIKLSTADGEDGEGVDYVMPMGTLAYNSTDNRSVCRVAYSCDAGLHWTVSPTVLSWEGFDPEEAWEYESGVSEATILEAADGTLVLYKGWQVTLMIWVVIAAVGTVLCALSIAPWRKRFMRDT